MLNPLTYVTRHQSVSSEKKKIQVRLSCAGFLSVCRWFMCWRSKHAFVLLFGARNQCQVFDLDQGICTCWPAPAAERQENMHRNVNESAHFLLEKATGMFVQPLEPRTGAGNLSYADVPRQIAGTRPSVPCPPHPTKGPGRTFPTKPSALKI